MKWIIILFTIRDRGLMNGQNIIRRMKKREDDRNL